MNLINSENFSKASEHRSNYSLVMAPSVTAACDVPGVGLAVDSWLAGSDVVSRACVICVWAELRMVTPQVTRKIVVINVNY